MPKHMPIACANIVPVLLVTKSARFFLNPLTSFRPFFAIFAPVAPLDPVTPLVEVGVELKEEAEDVEAIEVALGAVVEGAAKGSSNPPNATSDGVSMVRVEVGGR
jgi:hypothetical protein